jgi:peptide/nickel transport system ATP-binding protein
LPNNSRISGEVIFRSNEGGGKDAGNSDGAAAPLPIDLLSMKKTDRRHRAIRGRKISMIFQDPQSGLNPVYRVGDQIVENILAHEKVSRNEAWERAAQMLETLSIPKARDRMNDYPHQFSGGMKQRVMIAMGLICSPELLIADEPTTALDVTIQAQILELIRELQTKLNFTVILITHNMGIVADLADDIAVMYMGKIVESGTKEDIFLRPCHPYTKALLKSVPVLGNQEKKNLEPIRGNTPDPSELPSGCAFAPRCDYSRPECSNQPVEITIEGDHQVCCFLYQNNISEHTLTDELDQAKNGNFAQSTIAADNEIITPQAKAHILLEMKNIKKHFPITTGIFRRQTGQIRAVDGVDLFVKRGETLGLVGESGCGKTTLGKCAVRLTYPDSGELRYNFGDKEKDNYKDLLSLNREERFHSRRKIQMIFQDPYSSLNPVKNIFTAFDEPLKLHGWINAAERKDIIAHSLERVNLRPDYMYRYPHEFSGGQRQRICIARSLCVEPELVVCDEPVSSLDVSIQAQVLNLMKELQANLSLTYIFIAHDLSVVEYMSDRIAVMYLGIIVELAPAEALYNKPRHPYTEALLSAVPIPRLGEKPQRIILEGDVPSPADPPSGCRFHTRCRKCQDRCRTETPELRPIDGMPDHFVACWII